MRWKERLTDVGEEGGGGGLKARHDGVELGDLGGRASDSADESREETSVLEGDGGGTDDRGQGAEGGDEGDVEHLGRWEGFGWVGRG